MLSLCMIVKNEGKYLRDCLASVKNVVDEIIIVDTGSTDNTKQIASEYDAKIYDYKWNDDFSSARNYSLKKAKGDWILYLDADERLAEESISIVRQLVDKPGNAAYECRILNIDEFQDRPSVMKYIRLFPKLKNVMFEGKVHEQIEKSLLDADCVVQPCDVEIIHLGYSVNQTELKLKAERNLKILLGEAEGSSVGYVYFQIGQSYHILNNEKKAIEYFEKALQDISLRNEYKATALRSIAIFYAESNNYSLASSKIEKSLKCDPNQPLSQLAASKIFLKIDRKSEALKAAHKAYQLNTDFENGKLTSSQSILADIYSIIYNGLNTSFLCGDNKEHNYFFEIFEKEETKNNRQGFIAVYKKLAQSKPLEKSEIDLLKGFVNDDNIELIITLLNNYKDLKNVLNILDVIEKAIPDNIYLLNYYGLKTLESMNLSKAESLLSKSLELGPYNPSTILYLISVLVQQNKVNEAVNLITEKKDSFADQPEVLNKFNIVLQRLAQVL